MERNRRKQLTVVIKAVVLLSLLGTLLIHQWITIDDTRQYEVEPFFINYTQYGCVVPYLDPFDPSITQYINTPQPLTCHGTQYELTYLDSEGWLKLNSTEIASSWLNLNCFYRCYDRTEGDDIAINYSDWKLIANYTTYYAEDYPSFNLFYYLAKGFRNKPVDHYFRPFWLNVYWSYLHRKSKHLCYGNEAMHNLQLHYLSQFIQKYEELGHDYLNQVNVGDEDLANFLTEHYQSLKNRNCVQANIPEEYCICHKETEINTGEAVVSISLFPNIKSTYQQNLLQVFREPGCVHTDSTTRPIAVNNGRTGSRKTEPVRD
uniref:Transmembrane protein n=1 Tax=Heterorhabditis bacteriophora TaxID=37862 RepID=A0A1I7XKY9_HETBA